LLLVAIYYTIFVMNKRIPVLGFGLQM